MADKAARVRLEMSNAGFLSAMQQNKRAGEELEDQIDKFGNSLKSASQNSTALTNTLRAGAEGAKAAVGDLAGKLKTAVTAALTLGGALSFGAAAKSATDLVDRYRDIAFALELASGKAVDYRDIQQTIDDVADQTNQKLAELTGAYDMLAGSVNKGFGDRELLAVGQAATATGGNVQLLAKLAVDLHQKFGLTGEALKAGLAETLHTMNAAGMGLEQFSSEFGGLGASAQMNGLKGAEGLNVMLHSLEKIRPQVKDAMEAAGGFKAAFERLGDVKFFEALQKAAGVKLKLTGEEDVTERIRKVLESGDKARVALFESFPQRETQAVLTSLTKPFEDAFEQAKATGANTKDATAKGLAAYDAALREAAQATTSFSRIQEQAADRAKDPKAQLDKALNELTQAFAQPELVSAIDTVAEKAPAFARFLADLVDFAARNPLLAGGLAVGGVAAKGAVVSVSQRAATAAGEVMAARFSSLATKHPGWAAAGKSLGVAAAALIAFEVGKALIDAGMDKDERNLDKARMAGADVEAMAKHGTGTRAEREKAAKDLKREITRMEKDGPGLTTRLFGSAANFADSSVEHPVTRHQRELQERKRQLAMLEADVEGPTERRQRALADQGAPASTGAARRRGGSDEPVKATISNEAALAQAMARQLGGTTLTVRVLGGGGNGSNGLPPAPGNDSGSTP